jgi:hypothetical protein
LSNLAQSVPSTVDSPSLHLFDCTTQVCRVDGGHGRASDTEGGLVVDPKDFATACRYAEIRGEVAQVGQG